MVNDRWRRDHVLLLVVVAPHVYALLVHDSTKPGLRKPLCP